MGFDQAVYAACGYAIKNGGVPIQTAQTQAMGIMLMYALPMLFTLSPIAIHAFTLIWTAVTAITIGSIGAKLLGGCTGIVAAVLYWLVTRASTIGAWIKPSLSDLFLVLAFWLLWKNPGDWRLRLEIGPISNLDL